MLIVSTISEILENVTVKFCDFSTYYYIPGGPGTAAHRGGPLGNIYSTIFVSFKKGPVTQDYACSKLNGRSAKYAEMQLCTCSFSMANEIGQKNIKLETNIVRNS